LTIYSLKKLDIYLKVGEEKIEKICTYSTALQWGANLCCEH